MIQTLRIATIGVIAASLILLLSGCAYTKITYEHTRADGSKIAGSYLSSKNLIADVDTNGTLHIQASASEATDANTRLIKQTTESLIQFGATVAK